MYIPIISIVIRSVPYGNGFLLQEPIWKTTNSSEKWLRNTEAYLAHESEESYTGPRLSRSP